MTGILLTACWLLWFLGGLWLTIRSITSYRHFWAWELLFAVPLSAIAGPILALGWAPPGDERDPLILFEKRRKGPQP